MAIIDFTKEEDAQKMDGEQITYQTSHGSSILNLVKYSHDIRKQKNWKKRKNFNWNDNTPTGSNIHKKIGIGYPKNGLKIMLALRCNYNIQLNHTEFNLRNNQLRKRNYC